MYSVFTERATAQLRFKCLYGDLDLAKRSCRAAARLKDRCMLHSKGRDTASCNFAQKKPRT